MIPKGTRQAIERDLGASLLQLRPVSGGDINEAYAAATSAGHRVFIKCNRSGQAGLFAAEAVGLEWLAQASAIALPRVLGVSERAGSAGYLVLEFVERGSPCSDFDERLGHQLAELHRSGAEGFGFHSDNFIGSLPQANHYEPNWAEFYARQRLAPLVGRTRDAGLIGRETALAFERLCACMAELAGPREPPARLHGDLWGGNLHATATGEPCLIDPAVYGGHREVDLAMMKLFGGFGLRVFEAYDEAYPLAPGHEHRVALYQLYPLLVHACLFGRSYVGSLERALASYA